MGLLGNQVVDAIAPCSAPPGHLYFPPELVDKNNEKAGEGITRKQGRLKDSGRQFSAVGWCLWAASGAPNDPGLPRRLPGCSRLPRRGNFLLRCRPWRVRVLQWGASALPRLVLSVVPRGVVWGFEEC